VSWKATSWVKSLRTYTDGTPLTVREKFVLLILADYHNEENGYAWVSYNRLAHEALTDRTTVIRLLKKLHLDSGLLRVVRRTKAADENAVNHYFFAFDDAGGVVAPRHQGGGTTPLGVVAPRHQGGGKAEPPSSGEALPLGVVAQPCHPSLKEAVIEQEEEKQNPTRARARSSVDLPPPDLPDWIPKPAWLGFIQMRATIRRPLTAYAARLVIQRLKGLANQGYQPGLVLEQSILHSWQGVFPLKEQSNGSNEKESAAQRRSRRNQEAGELAVRSLSERNEPGSR
jgi:hypothetical protein